MRGRRASAVWLALMLVVVYNSNGRELGTVDSQPAKFTVRALVLHRTLTLDRVVAERPGLLDRPVFARDRDGHVRSAYSVVPALAAAPLGAALHATGLAPLSSPQGPNLIAALSASLIVTAAVVLLFLTLTRVASLEASWLAACAIGLGTNYWALASRTLWGHETVAFGVALALWATCGRPALRHRQLWTAGAGLGLALAVRPQIAPLVAVLVLGLWHRVGFRQTLPVAGTAAAGLAALILVNVAWFGHPLGATPQLEAVHPSVHAVDGSVGAQPWWAALGLLASPNRGLLVFSPILVVAFAGWQSAASRRPDVGSRWLVASALVQFLAYAFYSVWWGGHTYGPRYALDAIAPLAPSLALGFDACLRRPLRRLAAAALLAWSVGVSALGAYVYPHERWNTDPDDVDRHHVRLWTFDDWQIARALAAGSNPANLAWFEPGGLDDPAR